MSDILQIKDFKGTNFEYGQWAEGFGNYVRGIDIFGLQDNASKFSKAGVMQCMRIMNAGTSAAAPNDVTDLMRHFEYYPTTATVWGLSGESTPRLYERSGTTWTMRRTGPTDLLTAAGGGGLKAFGGSLWTAQNARVSRWDNTTWTAQFGASNLSSTGATVRPMKVFADVLMIGNGRYIDSISSTPSLNLATASPRGSNTFIVPADFTIQSMEIYRDRLYISADNGSYARIFVWDGVSTNYENAFDMLDESTAPFLIFNQGVLWAVSVRGTASPSGAPLYIFNGSAFDKIMMLPIGVLGQRTSVATYRGGILIASSNPGATSNITSYPDTTGGVGGIWMINRHNVNHPYQAVHAFTPAVAVTSVNIGGIYASNMNVFASIDTNSFIYELALSDTHTAGQWDSQPIDAGDASRNKMWHAIQVDVESVGANNTLSLNYRTNYTTNAYTNIKTVSTDTVANNIMPIGVMGKVIQLRMILSSVAGTASTRLHGISLYYTLLN